MRTRRGGPCGFRTSLRTDGGWDNLLSDHCRPSRQFEPVVRISRSPPPVAYHVAPRYRTVNGNCLWRPRRFRAFSSRQRHGVRHVFSSACPTSLTSRRRQHSRSPFSSGVLHRSSKWCCNTPAQVTYPGTPLSSNVIWMSFHFCFSRRSSRDFVERRGQSRK